MNVLEINVDDVGLGGVYSLVNSVIRNRPDNLKMDIACIAEFENQDNISALKHLGTEVYYIGTAGSRLMRPVVYYRKTLRLLRKGGYECAHVHGDVAYLMLIFALAARRAGIPKIILHSHAAGIDGSARRLKAVLHGLCRNLITRHATDFAACSDVAATWMFPHLKPESVRMIYNGIELLRFAFDQEQRRRVREDLGLENAFVVGHVG